jgi:lipopolysaccharide transport system ATP-binding protein
MTVILEAKNIALTYKTRKGFLSSFSHQALKGISFELYKGETIGILGRNGGGKSTLLRILAGIINPTSGQVSCVSGTTRALLSVGLGFMPNTSGRENAIYSAMLQGASKKKALSVVDKIRDFAELGEFFEQPVDTYSSGMRARLGFATALMTDVDILFIDEILSVGDMHFRQKAESAMLDKLNGEQTCVFVSHNPEQVNKICSRAIWIEDGVIRAQGETKTVANEYKNFMESL